jgi:hypothetical protein
VRAELPLLRWPHRALLVPETRKMLPSPVRTIANQRLERELTSGLSFLGLKCSPDPLSTCSLLLGLACLAQMPAKLQAVR